MQEKKIIHLFEERSELAIEETRKQYGGLIRSLLYRMLGNMEDTEECENDTYLGLWNSIPPTKPKNLKAYLLKIARNRALKRVEYLGKSFPESDTFNISIRSLEVIQENGIGIEIKGRWKFSIPINVNTKDIKTVQVKEISEGHSIDKVIVSPIMLTVYTSYPDIYRGTVNYEVVAFSDISEDDVTIQGQYGATSGVTRIPRNRVGNVLDIYVLDSSVLKKTGIKKYTRENIEPYAIVHKQIELQ